MEAWLACLAAFKQAVQGLVHLKPLFFGALPDQIWGYDPGKLVISTRGTGLSGHALAQILHAQYQIEIEMAAGDYIVAMTSPADTPEGLLQFARALCRIDAQLEGREDTPAPAMPQLHTVLAPWQVADSAQLDVPAALADGYVAAEYVWAYPPGIPLVVPGEMMDSALIGALADLQAHGTQLHSTTGGMPEMLRVLEENDA